MPNPWTGIGNPYTRQEVVDRLNATLAKGEPIIAAGAGTGISAKFIEKGGADLIIIYNSGRFRMMGHGSTAGMMAYGDANAIAMEIGEYEVLPIVKKSPSSAASTPPIPAAACGTGWEKSKTWASPASTISPPTPSSMATSAVSLKRPA
jgi:hypothetical protein